jgi:hypothetical protein
MKYNAMMLTIAMGVGSVFTGNLYAQEQVDFAKSEQYRMDSLETISRREKVAQQEQDQVRMADARSEKKQTKAKAKEAKRIERDASDAARESRYALKTERKAQKSRKQADKQSQKASKARIKSESN